MAGSPYREDKTNIEISSNSSNGKSRGISRLPNGLGGAFPAPLISPLPNSLGDWKDNYKFKRPDLSYPYSNGEPMSLNYPGVESKTGFTDVERYGESIERLNFDVNNLKNTNQPVIERLDARLSYYDISNDLSGKQFTHLLDYFNGQIRKALPTGEYIDGSTVDPNIQNIHLGSFIRTLDDNEDPTMLGYDIIIKWAKSPLLNGSIENFINTYSSLGNTEIGSRLKILNEFKLQLTKFLKVDEPSKSPSFLGLNGVKTYYLKSLSGLNNLVEQNTSDTIKSFVKYGSEYIELGFHEDVTQNIGYLSSLYKSLYWSRINGKSIIPENLLRFDVDIVITEIRKYNRVFKNISDNTLDIYQDLISKYTYTLYECQFFFPTLPHGDSLDMSNNKVTDEYKIKFNYKYSTMKFSKFNLVGKSKEEFAIDNKKVNLNKIDPNDTNNNSISGGSILNKADVFELKDTKLTPKEGDIQQQRDLRANELSTVRPDQIKTDTTDTFVPPTTNVEPAKKILNRDAIERARNDLERAAINRVNRAIVSQASLLNKTLDNIRNTIPFAGRLSEPTNVYNDNRYADIINVARNFVGDSLRPFISPLQGGGTININRFFKK